MDLQENTQRYGGTGAPLERQVYAQLLERIRSGHYKLGEKLPAEKDLTAEYGVSRPVIRTALARLRDDGLLVSRKGAGSFISGGGQDVEGGFAPLQGVNDIEAYIAFRKMIECTSAAEAARHVNAEAVAELREILEEMDEIIDAGVATVDLDSKFHYRIAELSDNRFLLETLTMLRSHTFFIGKFVRSLGSTGYRKGKRAMNGEHHVILDAIEAGDPEAARQAMLDHIEASERRVFKGE
ncbi:MAG: FadR family transcriptional regulator [Rhodospirillales bacterium]|nr:FadR family transcriptional regulator [Rhodospirillales bacterium]